MKKLIWFLLAIIGAVLAAFFYFQTRKLDQSGHERFDTALRKLKHVDTIFTGEVLKARFKILDNYDDFPRYEQELAELAVELRNVPDFVDARGKASLTNLLKNYSALLQKRTEMFEDFKSQNAVLNNSLSYFPTAGDELIKQISDQPDNRELEVALNDLLREVLNYSLNPGEEPAAVQACIDRVKDWRTQHPRHPDALPVSILLTHARTILNRKPVVDGLTRDIVSFPTAENLEEISRVYQVNLTHALNQSGFYRVILYLLCAALVICVACVLVVLRASNRNLELRVRERTGELSHANDELQKEMTERQRVQSQLLETSRMAGMAEVATGILHNVGNILNSVNVSVGVVLKGVIGSKAAGIQKVANLLNGHPDLGAFFASDPKAKQVPGYLAQLAAQVGLEQQAVTGEIENLQKHIDHIKDVVAMQQGYARVSGVRETVDVHDLVEDALRLNASSLARHGLNLVKEFSEVPPITVEKHKILQILVNLVSNAKQACDEAGKSDKTITVRVDQAVDRVRISVIDNGVGIPPENLPRIFSHGFTTRKEGHGFGLHNSALAAKELGGALQVHSDGSGKGAAFTLELPVQQPDMARN